MTQFLLPQMFLLWILTIFIFIKTNESLPNTNFVGASSSCQTNNVTFNCLDKSQCLSWSMVCDDKSDCDDGSDEDKYACIAKDAHLDDVKCDSYEEFQCLDKSQCISNELVCDGNRDCNDGSDEIKCAEMKCHVSCSNGIGCVTSGQICDGKKQCADGSDEFKCRKYCNNKNQLFCRPPINESLTEEEKGKSIETIISYRSTCFYTVNKCDQRPHCSNGVDERACPMTCGKTEFACADGKQCIAQQRVCDDVQDCKDHSDETICYKLEKAKCNKDSEFQCNGGSGVESGEIKCIPLTKVCDGRPDCFNATDERATESHANCLIDPCQNNNGGCEHVCVNYFGKAKCLCRKGYVESIHQPGKCEDVNECNKWGQCPQECLNTPGSYRCHCSTSKYTFIENENTCEPNVKTPFALLYNTPNDIRLFFPKSTRLHKLYRISKEHSLTAIDYGLYGNKIIVFWSEKHDGHNCIVKLIVPHVLHSSITNLNIDENKSEILSIDEDINAMSFDSINMLLYWITDEGIFVMNTMNKQWTNLLKLPGLGMSLVVVPNENKLYFIHKHENKILSCSLDGKNVRQELHADFVADARYLSWDYSLNRLVWLDIYNKIIYSFHPKTKDLKKLNLWQIKWSKPIGFAMFNEHYYWTDSAAQGSINSISKFKLNIDAKSSNNAAVFVEKAEEHAHAIYLQVVHPYNRPQGFSHCSHHNCSHICVPTSQSKPQCLCPVNSILNLDNQTCLENKTNNSQHHHYHHHHHHHSHLEHHHALLNDKNKEQTSSQNSSSLWIILPCIAVALSLLIVCLLLRSVLTRFCGSLFTMLGGSKKRTQAVHFDNPVYDKATITPTFERKFVVSEDDYEYPEGNNDKQRIIL